MKNKIYLILLLLIILSVSVISFDTYVNFGNSEKVINGCSYWAFSSCYPQNDLSLNFSKQVLSQSLLAEPIIWTHLNSYSILTSERFLYAFSGISLNIYYLSNFELYNSNVLKGNIIGNPYLMRNDNIFNGYLLFYPYAVGNQYFVNVCDSDINGNICINTDFTFEISNKTIEVIYDKNYGRTSTLLSNGTIETFDFIGNKINSFSFNIAGKSSFSIIPPNNNKYLSVGDFNSDGYEDIVFAVPYAYKLDTGNLNQIANMTIGIYTLFNDYSGSYSVNPFNVNLINNFHFTTSYIHILNSQINMVTLGSQTSLPKISILVNYMYNGTSADKYFTSNFLYSFDGIEIYNDNPLIASSDEVLIEQYESNAVFSDINYDSYNEMCINKNNSRLYCYDVGLNLILNVSSSYHKYMSFGKYTNSSYMSVMFNDGIYEINNTDLIKIFNFSNPLLDDISYPISMYNKINRSNDVFIISTNQLIAYRLNSPSSVCGDGFCSITENPLLCPIDCPVDGEEITAIKTTGEFCLLNSECISGLCDINKCALKNGGVSCLLNSECLSNSCLNGFCVQAGISNSFKQMTNNLFGFNNSDGILLYLVVALLVFIIGSIASAYLGMFIPLIIGGILDIIILIGFTFIGITAGWFLLMVVILLILIAFIIFILNSSQ